MKNPNPNSETQSGANSGGKPRAQKGAYDARIKHGVMTVFIVLYAFLLWGNPLVDLLMDGKPASSSTFWLLRVETLVIGLFLLARFESLKRDVYRALAWKDSVGVLRYGVACLAAAFVILAWSFGKFPSQAFANSSAFWFELYLHAQLYAFFGLTAAGATLVALTLFIETYYDCLRENYKFLHPYQFVDDALKKMKDEPQNGLIRVDELADLLITAWSVNKEEETLEYEAVKRLVKEKDGKPVPDELGKWAAYKVTMDFKGRILSIQRREVDDYQKIRFA